MRRSSRVFSGVWCKLIRHRQQNAVVAERMAEGVQNGAKGETAPSDGVTGQASVQGSLAADAHSAASEAVPENSFQGWRVSTIFGPL